MSKLYLIGIISAQWLSHNYMYMNPCKALLDFYCTMIYIARIYAVKRCLSVHLSVTHW